MTDIKQSLAKLYEYASKLKDDSGESSTWIPNNQSNESNILLAATNDPNTTNNKALKNFREVRNRRRFNDNSELSSEREHSTSILQTSIDKFDILKRNWDACKDELPNHCSTFNQKLMKKKESIERSCSLLKRDQNNRNFDDEEFETSRSNIKHMFNFQAKFLEERLENRFTFAGSLTKTAPNQDSENPKINIEFVSPNPNEILLAQKNEIASVDLNCIEPNINEINSNSNPNSNCTVSTDVPIQKFAKYTKSIPSIALGQNKFEFPRIFNPTISPKNLNMNTPNEINSSSKMNSDSVNSSSSKSQPMNTTALIKGIEVDVEEFTVQSQSILPGSRKNSNFQGIDGETTIISSLNLFSFPQAALDTTVINGQMPNNIMESPSNSKLNSKKILSNEKNEEERIQVEIPHYPKFSPRNFLQTIEESNGINECENDPQVLTKNELKAHLQEKRLLMKQMKQNTNTQRESLNTQIKKLTTCLQSSKDVKNVNEYIKIDSTKESKEKEDARIKTEPNQKVRDKPHPPVNKATEKKEIANTSKIIASNPKTPKKINEKGDSHISSGNTNKPVVKISANGLNQLAPTVNKVDIHSNTTKNPKVSNQKNTTQKNIVQPKTGPSLKNIDSTQNLMSIDNLDDISQKKYGNKNINAVDKSSNPVSISFMNGLNTCGDASPIPSITLDKDLENDANNDDLKARDDQKSRQIISTTQIPAKKNISSRSNVGKSANSNSNVTKDYTPLRGKNRPIITPEKQLNGTRNNNHCRNRLPNSPKNDSIKNDQSRIISVNPMDQ